MDLILKHLGYLMVLFGIFPILPVLYALFNYESVLPFFVPIFISIGVGLWLMKLHREKEISISAFDLPKGVALCALSFVIMSVIGAIPYLMYTEVPIIDALFESVSGFSTTGLTIFTDVESLPKSILLWRAETQWIGGLGIVLVFLLIVSAMRQQESLKETTTKAKAIASLYQAQGASEKLESNMKKSVDHMIIIYLTYTIIGIFLLIFAGLTVFESVAISFTAISTAGFSVTNVFYDSWPVLFIISFLMIAGATSFVFHNRLFKGHVYELWRNKAFKFFIFSMAGAVFVVYLFVKDFKVAFFETMSAFTTTGFSITDIDMMHSMAIMVIMLSMIVGGMIGSTAGGIKINRLKLMLVSIPWLVKKGVSPSEAIIPLKVDDRIVDKDMLLVSQAFIFCYLVILVIGTSILMFTGISFLHSSFQVTSALGGVGLQTTNIDVFKPLAKIVLMIAMLFGRLEIFPLLILGKFLFNNLKDSSMRRDESSRKLFYTKWLPSFLWKRRL